jgi:ABC-2 type transport system permease protein
MSPRISAAIVRHEFRVMWTDPSTVIFVVVMPLFMAALMKNLFASALVAQGFSGANGSEFAVPGMAAGFAAFGSSYAGFTFFRDHGWGTWDRLRATSATSVDLIVGKVIPTVLVSVVQLGLLFVLGGPLFDLHIRGSIPALALVIVVLGLSLSAFGMAVTAAVRTMAQLNAIGSVGAFGMAMLGGAWVPVESMPGWARAVAPVMPTYWAMNAFQDIILRGAGLADVARPVLVLIGFGSLFTAVAAWKFRFEESKAYYG